MSSVVTRCAFPGYFSSGIPRDGSGVVPMTRTGGSCMASGGFASGGWVTGGCVSGVDVVGGSAVGGCAKTGEPTRSSSTAAHEMPERTSR